MSSDYTNPPHEDEAKPPIRVAKPTKSLPDDALPPVQAPNAGFILQLFFIPMIIVGIIVVVWLMFYWLANMGSDPRELVRGLKKGDNAAWQKANILADMLSSPQNEHLKYDRELAKELANVLQQQLEDGQTNNENLIKLRVFLCRAIGEFKVDDGLPALMKAATVERDAAEIEPENPKEQRTLTEIDVRRAALEAIAVLATNIGTEPLRNNRELMDMLLRATRERGDPQRDEYLRAKLRSTAAYTLGVLGGDEALDRLEQIQFEDSNPDARFNATTGLARHGDERAVVGLLAMLDPENEDLVEGERYEGEIEFKRELVMRNGIRATQMLARKNSAVDLTELKQSLRRISESELPSGLRVEAKEVLLSLE